MEGTDGGEVGWPQEDLKAKKSWMGVENGDGRTERQGNERRRGWMWDGRVRGGSSTYLDPVLYWGNGKLGPAAPVEPTNTT